MNCPACGTLNPAQARFCMTCGTMLVMGKVCNQCHTLLPYEARYCFHCGVYQPQPVASQPGVPAAPQIYPPQVAVPPVMTPNFAAPVPSLPQAQIPPAQTPVVPAPQPQATVRAQAVAPAAPGAAAPAQVNVLPAPLALNELLPSLQRYLPASLYEPLERRPQPRHLQQASDHLKALLETFKTYLPRPVFEAPQPPGVPAGGLQQGVFLFGDVSGFTPLSEQLKKQGQRGAERIMEIINDLFTDLVKELFFHGGDLLKFGGDAMLGVFPARTDEEMRLAALRATQAGLAMQRVMQQERFTTIPVGEETRALKIKCGISAGPYFAAHIGTPHMMAFVTTGHTVNLAEQAEGHANPEEIAMTLSAYEWVKDQIEVGPVNKEPDDNFRRVIDAPRLEQAVERPDAAALPDGDVQAQITFLVERLNRLAAYLSPELIGRIVTNPGNPRISPDHRPVTVMFANYEGISELIGDLGDTRPEVIVHHLNDYFVHMAEVVERYEGTLARMDQYAVGDRLVIFFGAPRAHEDDPMRAVYTALEMQQAVENNFAALPIETAVYRFRQRIGINTGHLFAGNAGAPNLRQEYTLMGDDINMAARLMSKAGWQDIFVSDKTYERVHELFDLEDKGELKVKGKEIKIRTYKVKGRVGQYRQIRGWGTEKIPMLGRDQELEQLAKSFEALLKERGQIVVVTGDSGLGKTRLMREARTWLEHHSDEGQIRWVEGHALSFSEQVSYWLATDVMEHILELPPDEPSKKRLYKLWETCETLLGKETSREVVPYLAGLVGVEEQSEWRDIYNLDPRVRQKQTFWAARQFFAALARQHTTVIVLDDLHWADEASLALFADLLSVTDEAPLMFYLIMRQVREKGAWRLRDRAERDFHHRYSEVALAPLDRAHTNQMLAALLPGATLPDELLKEIYDKSIGNPFYIDEIVQWLKDLGAVVPEESEPDYLGELISNVRRKPAATKEVRWKVQPDQIQSIGVPDTLHSALISRLDRLTGDARQALQIAAVIGREFQLEVLRNLSEGVQSLQQPLAQLERNNLIQPVDLSQEGYQFPDALIQEVAYENLLMQRRMEVHSRVGAILEHLYGERADQECEKLAFHYYRSNNTERAIHYLELAGRKAQTEYANQTALEHYTNLLNLLANTPENREQRFKILGLRQKIYGVLGKNTDRLQDLQTMQSMAQECQNEAWRGETLVNLADMYSWTGRYNETTQAAQEALEIMQRTDNLAGQAAALHNLGVVSYYRGQYAQANEYLEPAINLRRQIGDLEGETWSEMYLGMMYFMQGNYDMASQHCTHALQISQDRQDWAQIGIHQTNAGRISLRLGSYASALEQLEHSLEMKTRVGDVMGQCFSLYAIGQAHYYLEQMEQAEASLQKALTLCLKAGNRRVQAQSQYGLGLVALARQHYREALKYFKQAQVLHAELGLNAEQVADYSFLGQAYLASGQLPEAQQASHQAMELLASYPTVEEVQQVYVNHYRLLAACNDPAAEEIKQQARFVVQKQAECIADPSLRASFLENVKVNREIMTW